jgi:hypothetical protein
VRDWLLKRGCPERGDAVSLATKELRCQGEARYPFGSLDPGRATAPERGYAAASAKVLGGGAHPFRLMSKGRSPGSAGVAVEL